MRRLRYSMLIADHIVRPGRTSENRVPTRGEELDRLFGMKNGEVRTRSPAAGVGDEENEEQGVFRDRVDVYELAHNTLAG